MMEVRPIHKELAKLVGRCLEHESCIYKNVPKLNKIIETVRKHTYKPSINIE